MTLVYCSLWGRGRARGGSRLCHPDVNIVLSTENMLSIYTFSTAGEGGKHQFGPGGELLGGGVLLTDTASTLSYSPIALCMTISILYREFLTFQLILIVMQIFYSSEIALNIKLLTLTIAFNAELPTD